MSIPKNDSLVPAVMSSSMPEGLGGGGRGSLLPVAPHCFSGKKRALGRDFGRAGLGGKCLSDNLLSGLSSAIDLAGIANPIPSLSDPAETCTSRSEALGVFEDEASPCCLVIKEIR